MDAKAIQRVRDAIINYKVEREVVKVVEDPLLTLRNSLTYGKMVINRSTTAYEYFTAHFSAPLPRKFLPFQMSSDEWGCQLTGNMTNQIVIASRGECSFLDKATNASSVNASALVVINNSTELFQIAAGYATGHQQEDVLVPKDLPVVSNTLNLPPNSRITKYISVCCKILIKQHAKMALQLASHAGLEARMIPLRCASGESGCSPVLPEEENIHFEVLKYTRHYHFLTISLPHFPSFSL